LDFRSALIPKYEELIKLIQQTPGDNHASRTESANPSATSEAASSEQTTNGASALYGQIHGAGALTGLMAVVAAYAM
jgi:hypothetical protein